MSVKNMLDLNTLGHNTNDSRGDNCYISEKGIQALPASLNYSPVYLSGDVGRYLTFFFLGGVTYMVFDNYVINENGSFTSAYFIDQGDNGFEIKSTIQVPKNFFSGISQRNIKSVSYFTKTNKKIILYSKNINKDSIRFIEYNLTDNIIVVFSNNILAMRIKEFNNNVFFIKNPIFNSLIEKPTGFECPFGVYEFQSFFFLPEKFLSDGQEVNQYGQLNKVAVMPDDYTLLENVNSVSTGEWSFYMPSIQINNTTYLPRTYSGINNKLYLMESTVVLYDRKSGDVKIVFSTSKNNMSYFDSQNRFFFGLNTWYHFNNRKDYNTIGHPVLDIIPPFDNNSAPLIYPLINGNHRVIPYALNIGLDNTPGAFIHYKKSDYFKNYNVSLNDGSTGVALERQQYSITNLSNIDDIRRKVNEIMNDSDTLTMAGVDKSNLSINANMRSIYAFGVLSFLPIYVINDDADLKGSEMNFYSTNNIYAQRNRIFCTGVKITKQYPFTNDFDISNKDYSVSVNKFKNTFMTAGSNFSVDEIEYGKEKTVNYEVIEKTLFKNGNKAIYFWFTWPLQSLNIEESKNRVYYSNVGDFYIEFIDGSFIEPSNMADKLIAVWGNNRDLYTIGEKSMEQFNISDSSVSPLSFVRLFKTYQKLIDWTALNNNFSILTYENSNFYLNDVSFIRKDLFNAQSLFGAETSIKGIPFIVIDNGERGKLLIDRESRVFNANNDQFIQAISMTKYNNPVFSNNRVIHYVNLENENKFKVSFFYRTEENILLRYLSINAAAYDRQASEKKKNYKVYRNEKKIFERNSSQQTVNFYSLGRGWNDNLSVECQGYLKSIIVEDTAIGQKK